MASNGTGAIQIASSEKENRHHTEVPANQEIDVRSLGDTEWLTLCRAIGAIGQDSEKLAPVLSVSHLPDGLYKSILKSRHRSQRNYYICTFIYSTCVVLQVVLGAVLTALGASSNLNGIPITILAAGNTINAGIVALFHNSGLPGRFRNDWNVFRKVEMHVVELIHSGVVKKDLPVAEVIERCWAMYREATDTVLGNKPASYIGTPPVTVATEKS